MFQVGFSEDKVGIEAVQFPGSEFDVFMAWLPARHNYPKIRGAT